ncbi:putative DnaJ-like protein subfamily A member 2 [Hypsibius exemplaris]|uniref:DnaJ homolog subfamily B member 9 n=1 Tax=Hypsibius exemplaris TaxID=2072580 RepID=A0A1W0X1Y4_HYPEX|nr:putative DnaJ-like protein subfamily A member 2 [Hypsibius exemplaris]
MPDTKLYEILEISKDATEVEIKRAYRRLAREYHPDKNPGQSNDDMFKKISFAYTVLTDVNKRAIYDRHGLPGLRDGLSAGLFGEPPETPEQQIYDVEEVLTGLLVEVARSLRLEFPAGGIQEFTRGSLRVIDAVYRRDFLTIISETVKLSVQVYKALPSNVPPPRREEDRF